MILYDTKWYDDHELSKFEGHRHDARPADGTHISFEAAKHSVITRIRSDISELEAKLLEIESIKSGDDLDFSPNPFTGYLRSKDGELD